MSKVDTIAALMTAGLVVFSRHGFEGSSLRDIAALADVPLSTIHRYFGSKLELYAAIEEHVWAEIHSERLAMLEDATRERPARLADIMRALVAPVVCRVFDDSTKPSIDLIRSSPSVRRQDHATRRLIRGQQQFIERCIDEVAQVLPGAQRGRLVWAYSFAIGSLYSWQLLDHLYDFVLEDGDTLTADEATELLVRFVCGGFEALAAA